MNLDSSVFVSVVCWLGIDKMKLLMNKKRVDVGVGVVVLFAGIEGILLFALIGFVMVRLSLMSLMVEGYIFVLCE